MGTSLDHRAAGFAIAVSCAAMSPPAAAQVLPIPDPSQQLRTATRERNPDARPLVEGAGVRFTSQTPPSNADEIRFVLNALDVEGSSIYSDAEIVALAGDRLGREVSLVDVFAIAGELQARYRQDGYLFTRVVVPAQSIQGGAVRLEAIEAVLTVVEVEEPDVPVGPVIALAEAIVAELRGLRNPRTDQIESVLLRLNDIPGITRAAAVPRIGEGERGAVELYVNMERDAVDATVFADNRQSPILGKGLIGVVGSLNSWSPRGDSTTLSAFISSGFDRRDFGERWTVQAEHRHFIGSDGLNLRGRLLYSESRPGERVANFEIVGDQTEIEALLYYPLRRTRPLSIDVFGGVEYVKVDSVTPSPSLPGGVQLPVPDIVVDDSLTVASFGFEGLQRDVLGYTEGRAEVRVGLDLFGATSASDVNKSRSDGDATFALIKGEIERTLPVAEGWTLWGKAWGQASSTPLLASEEFAIGGAEIGRAYYPSEYVGDSGFGAAVELRWNETFAWRRFRAPVELYGYGDFGEVRNNGDGVPGYASITSAGFGLRTQIAGRVAVNLEAARPLNRPILYDGSDAWRFLFSASSSF